MMARNHQTRPQTQERTDQRESSTETAHSADQDLGHRIVSEKGLRTGARTVGTRLIQNDQIARSRARQAHLIRQQIERRAERPDHRHRFKRRALHPVADGDRVVLAQDLTEISGS